MGTTQYSAKAYAGAPNYALNRFVRVAEIVGAATPPVPVAASGTEPTQPAAPLMPAAFAPAEDAGPVSPKGLKPWVWVSALILLALALLFYYGRA